VKSHSCSDPKLGKLTEVTSQFDKEYLLDKRARCKCTKPYRTEQGIFLSKVSFSARYLSQQGIFLSKVSFSARYLSQPGQAACKVSQDCSSLALSTFQGHIHILWRCRAASPKFLLSLFLVLEPSLPKSNDLKRAEASRIRWSYSNLLE
jgi:hypothetical protein